MLVTDMLGFGGREKITTDLANGLCERGHEVLFVTLSNDQNDQASCLNKEIKFFELPSTYKGLGGLQAIGYWVKCLPAFIKLLKEQKPDIVHTHLFFQRLYFASLAIKLSRIKTHHYNTVHTSGLFYTKKGIINAIRLYTEQRAVKLNKAFLIAISDEVYKNTVKHFAKVSSGITMIHNGIDAATFDYHLKTSISKSFFGFKEDDIIITYVARITKGKDHLTLLKAWKMVSPQAPQAKLCLAGDGELKAQMQSFCKQEEIDSSVIFLDTVKNVPQLLAITDIGVFTSLFEGFGIAFFEQMFMQIPVIATNIPPFSQFVEHGKNGFLFKAGNAETLAYLILQLINDKNLREETGKEGYKTAQQFSIEEMITKHEKFYGLSQAV